MAKDTTNWKFDLGDRVVDRVSGFEGIVCIRLEHLNGCRQYGMYPKVDKDGKIPDAHYIDGEQLELVDRGLNEDKPIKRKTTGGAPSKAPSTNTIH